MLTIMYDSKSKWTLASSDDQIEKFDQKHKKCEDVIVSEWAPAREISSGQCATVYYYYMTVLTLNKIIS